MLYMYMLLIFSQEIVQKLKNACSVSSQFMESHELHSFIFKLLGAETKIVRSEAAYTLTPWQTMDHVMTFSKRHLLHVRTDLKAFEVFT